MRCKRSPKPHAGGDARMALLADIVDEHGHGVRYRDADGAGTAVPTHASTVTANP